MTGVWFETNEDASAHQHAMNVVPHGRYGGVLDDELLMALPPAYLPKVIAGMSALSGNGLRYPIPQYGIQSDVRAGLGVSYADRDKTPGGT